MSTLCFLSTEQARSPLTRPSNHAHVLSVSVCLLTIDLHIFCYIDGNISLAVVSTYQLRIHSEMFFLSCRYTVQYKCCVNCTRVFMCLVRFFVRYFYMCYWLPDWWADSSHLSLMLFILELLFFSISLYS